VASPAATDPGLTQIQLGSTPPAPSPADPAKVRAVERLLAARQDGSLNRKQTAEARRLVSTKERAGDDLLFGDPGSSIAAFDFQNDAIEAPDAGHFEVPVYILFANPDGQVVASRSEIIVFTRREAAWVCTGLYSMEVMAWLPEPVRDSAQALGAAEEYMRAQTFLRDMRSGGRRTLSYSLADIQKTSEGKVVVQCFRFASNLGKRGFDVNDAPIVLTRAADGLIRVESN
jgi:hypothetical protein